VARAGDEQQLQRGVEHAALGQLQQHAVAHVGGVQRNERVLLVGGRGERRLQGRIARIQRGGQRHAARALRQASEVGEIGTEMAVDEHHPVRAFQADPGQFRGPGVGRRQREFAPLEPRQPGVLPVLLTRGRQTQGRETVDARLAQRRDPVAGPAGQRGARRGETADETVGGVAAHGRASAPAAPAWLTQL
jgi:hypothetical protein